MAKADAHSKAHPHINRLLEYGPHSHQAKKSAPIRLMVSTSTARPRSTLTPMSTTSVITALTAHVCLSGGDMIETLRQGRFAVDRRRAVTTLVAPKRKFGHDVTRREWDAYGRHKPSASAPVGDSPGLPPLRASLFESRHTTRTEIPLASII
jgi:hypothetical protein